MTISLIAAVAHQNALGFNNTIPWYLKEDMQYFKEKTINKAVIMGYQTYLSLPKLLANRLNIILTRKNIEIENAKVVHSIKESLKLAYSFSQEVMVIGGEDIYNQFINVADKIYLTRIDLECIFDKKFPIIDSCWKMVDQRCFESSYKYCFETYEKT